jgi:lipopolysaccharide biosynthesis glycosyltransferase
MRALVFAIDDKYVIPFKVLWHSLMKTESVPEEAPVFILYGETLRPDSIRNIAEFLQKYGRTATFKDAGSFIHNDVPLSYYQISKTTYYRLFVASILPEEITSVVYLDSDAVVLRSVRELFDLKLKNPIAAADHMSPGNAFRLWGDLGRNYFQAGVLLADIRQWRMNKQEEKFKKILAEGRARIVWWDQDILNIAFENNWQRLPIWYNLSRKALSEIAEVLAIKNGCFFHLDGPMKPWKYYSKDFVADQWYALYFEAFGKKFDIKVIQRSMWRRLLSFLKRIYKAFLGYN